jgi:hypothetical protein
VPVELTRVVVVDQHLYTGTGLVHRWLSRVGNNLYHNIVAEAPIREGTLKAGIEQDFVQHEGTLRILSTSVASTAPHTKYVIEGTAGNGTGYIYSDGGWANRGLVDRLAGMRRDVLFRTAREQGIDTTGMWMAIDDGGPRFHLRVHGQRANNFMLAGYNRTARTHRALHPIFPGFIS